MRIKILFIMLLSSTLLFSQNYKKVKIYLNEINSAGKLNSAGLEIDHAHFNRDKSIDVFLDEVQFAHLQSSSLRYKVLIDDWYKYYSAQQKFSSFDKKASLMKTAQQYGVTGFDYGSMGGYYTLDEVIQKLDEMYAAYPNLITEKDSIGHSVENRPIYAVKISDNPNVDEDEPEVLYTALHHAREPESMMQMIYFMYYLLENYGTDSEVTYLVENREFYFIPVVNVDGYRYNEENNPNGGGMWRKNKRDNDDDGIFNESNDGVDLNRNYGYKWAYDNSGSSNDSTSAVYRGTAPFSEPETETVRQFCIAHDFKLALNYHTYSNLLITPWGYIPEETSDSLFYRDIASDMTQYNNYTWGFSSDIIYAVNGDSDDWFYGEQTEKNKILAMTPEVGSSFWPSEDKIIPLAEENVYPNLYLAWVSGGFVNAEKVEFDQEYYSAGDSGKISITLKNKGLQAAGNIRMQITSESDQISVSQDYIEIAKLESREEVSFPDAVQFVISDSVIAGENIELTVKVNMGNLLLSTEHVSLVVGVPKIYFADDASSMNDWISESNVSAQWELTTNDFYSSPSSFTDSKNGTYLSNSNVTLTKKTEIDLSEIAKPFLSFRTKFSIEKGWDYGQVLISADSGNTWTPVGGDFSTVGAGAFQPSGKPVYDGKVGDWVKEIIDLAQFTNDNILLKFQLKSDEYVEEDGWYIDDIEIFEYQNLVVSVENKDNVPSKFGLEQNYPNPFNPSTKIKYSIANVETRHASSLRNVTLKVYDILGREVATLVNKQQQPGNYEVEFNASKLTSGIYFYSLRSGEFVQSRKMILLK
ncbi:MAG: T9SS type A sorting domain-containing protein [Chlorobi bacterium]|nr:T9SS type A sorting domain-containing protein [Chlorobiota bacterium]